MEIKIELKQRKKEKKRLKWWKHQLKSILNITFKVK